MRLRRSLFACFAIIGGALAANAQEVTVKVGTVRSISTATILWGVEQGYFKDYGIKVVTETLDTAANSIALLAQNQLQLVEGGISAGYFNALEKNLPVTMVLDRVTSPLGHNLMLRPDLKGEITQLRQLKGKTIATNGQGAVSTYEVGKLLESDGLTINDVDIKVIPFTQYAIAFNNKAIDAAITIPPFTAQLLDGGHAVNFKDPDDVVKPHPLTIAVSMINTDFANANRELVRNYYVAYLRAIRDYCQAYHGGAQRAALIDLAIRTGTETRPELLHKYPWPARSPNGTINVESMLDMQAWFLKSKMSNAEFPADRIVDKSYVDYALRIAPGEFVCIVGPSGCGKSTLLRILAGLTAQTSGTIKVEATGWAVENAMVFQESGLFPWMNVEANVGFGLMTHGIPTDEATARVEAALKLVGLTRFRRHYPHQLSGGMRQRSAIARAFVTDPGMLLMDEPLAALDAQNRVILQAELVRIWEQTRKTVIYITHSIEEALLLGDRTVVMTAHPGRIKQIIDVPFPRPRNLMTLSASPEFGRLKLNIWQVLEAEVTRARSDEET